MKALGVIIVTSLAVVAHAADLPRASRFYRTTEHSNGLRSLLENTEVERPPAPAAPVPSGTAPGVSIPEEPTFTQVSTEEYDEYRRGITALHKILKPENMKTLKKLTAMLNQQNAHSTTADTTGAMSPEKLTALLTSAMATQPEGFDFNSMNRVLENWQQQMSRGPFANIVPAMPAPSPQFVQSTDPFPAIATTNVMPGHSTIYPALTNFAQVAPVQYSVPPIPYFQITPQAGYQFAQAQPAVEEFTSPQQLLSVQM
ncbi:conserved hypothetical protein [Neospora caninum Liverpool]|uniref:Uncharacterized protein n=1 Tax=Neospora caninum (strain Liverpool) TaxID=572307 RepID=F0VBM2_NEOCL|nr:conserved hypothetical protein [Neospora caninum Liverpool]CBZ51006.1 conserved hypothetical protein [Neospora caninum Liverpool]CEL68311.1 TPA: hypothetical protein BN1204_040810 [Neospora caninum Liverpool]|eukprot:XP_003881039.1 conserved hypothetical protein [Neospora caninum Liverpool]